MLSLAVASSALLMPGAPVGRTAAVQPRSTVNMAAKIANKQVWVDFASAAECKPGTVVSGFRYGQEIAIATEKAGGQFALSNKLPPTGQPATFGELVGKGQIVEPVSQTAFNMKTGKPVGTWCPSPIGKLILGRLVGPTDVPVYPCRKSGNNVQVLINVNAKAQFEQNYWRGVLDAQGKVDGGYY